jgi:DNA-binding MarR family transcriptional regulator
MLLQIGINALVRGGLPRMTMRTVATLLSCYDAEPPMTMTHLSVALGISNEGASNTLERLVTDGLVERVPHQTDKRVALVRLTPSGRTLCRRLVRAPVVRR